MKNIIKTIAVTLGGFLTFGCFALSGCNGNKNLKEYDIEPIVEIASGKIEGEYVTKGTDYLARNYKDDEILVFKGIPYAAPPTGDNRWRAPQPVEAWQGVKKCITFGANPYQGYEEPSDPVAKEGLIDLSYGLSEDCLTLNVWTNGKPRKGGMPVVFYIYGGAWASGSSTVKIYNGEFLASQEVVFVSVNYRLNIFGWFACSALAQEDPEGSTGNYGLMDIIKALDWVHENIESFGGDPNNITVFGASAGGNLVNSLMVSPKTQGRIAHADSMSYPPDIIKQDYPSMQDRIKDGDLFAQKAGGLDKLRELSAEDLYNLNLTDGGMGMKFVAPCQDGVYLDKGLIPALKEGRNKDVDYIVGCDYDPDCINHQEDPEDPRGPDDSQFASWFGDGFDKMDTPDVLMVGVNGFSKLRKAGGAVNTYVMQFRHDPPGRIYEGAYHGCDASYALGYFSHERGSYWKQDDYDMADIYASYFINFAKTGDPNGKSVLGKNLTTWEKSKGDYKFFAIDNDCKMDKTEKVGNIVANFRRLGYDFL